MWPFLIFGTSCDGLCRDLRIALLGFVADSSSALRFPPWSLVVWLDRMRRFFLFLGLRRRTLIIRSRIRGICYIAIDFIFFSWF